MRSSWYVRVSGYVSLMLHGHRTGVELKVRRNERTKSRYEGVVSVFGRMTLTGPLTGGEAPLACGRWWPWRGARGEMLRKVRARIDG